MTIRSTLAGTVYVSPKYSILRSPAGDACSLAGCASAEAGAVAVADADGPEFVPLLADFSLFEPPHAANTSMNNAIKTANATVFLIFLKSPFLLLLFIDNDYHC
jgi:hypothetical protein